MRRTAAQSLAANVGLLAGNGIATLALVATAPQSTVAQTLDGAGAFGALLTAVFVACVATILARFVRGVRRRPTLRAQYLACAALGLDYIATAALAGIDWARPGGLPGSLVIALLYAYIGAWALRVAWIFVRSGDEVEGVGSEAHDALA